MKTKSRRGKKLNKIKIKTRISGEQNYVSVEYIIYTYFIFIYIIIIFY